MKDLMKKIRKVYFYIPVCLCVCITFVILLFMSSCSAFKEIGNDIVMHSIADPKTGTPIFTREYDTRPYQINMAEIIKSRKAQKKKKLKEIIENYDKAKPVDAKDKY